MNSARQLAAWDWPHREHSHFCRAAGFEWHYQRLGSGPSLLLLHGTGASLHSWAGLLPLLAQHFDVLAVDLPGHGFSELPDSEQMSLPGMASALHELLLRLDYEPEHVVGHSAGAAVGARLCLDALAAPLTLISINGALLALPGLTGQFFSISARLLAGIPALPAWVAGLGGRRQFTRRLIEGTGSSLSHDEVEHYRQLVANPRHVAAALRMMANWELETLETQLSGLKTQLHLFVCEGDRTVPPSQSYELQRRLPNSELHSFDGLGHLGHEEEPEKFADALMKVTVS